MHALKNAPRELTEEERSRPISVNNCVTTLGSFLYLNDPASWPESSIAMLLAMKPGAVHIFGGGALAEFEIERIS